MSDETGIDHDERGATLIELLMGIVLTGVILAALTGGVMSYFRAADGIRYLLNETPELQLAASRFAADIQSAASVTNPPPSVVTPVCGALPSGAGSTTLLELSWTDPGPLAATSDDAVVTVSYTYDPTSHRLARAACKASTLVQRTTLVTHVQPSQTPSVSSPATNQWDLALKVCTANPSNTGCLDSVIPATLTGVRRSS